MIRWEGWQPVGLSLRYRYSNPKNTIKTASAEIKMRHIESWIFAFSKSDRLPLRV